MILGLLVGMLVGVPRNGFSQAIQPDIQAWEDSLALDLGPELTFDLLLRLNDAYAGDHAKAGAYAERTKALALAEEDDFYLATAHFMLAYNDFLHHYLARSVPNFKTSADIYDRIGDRRRAAFSLYYMGIALQDQGYLEEGLNHFEQALVRATEAQDLQAESVMLNALGPAYCQMHRYQEGQDAMHRALALTAEHGLNPSLTYNQMAVVQESLGCFDVQLEYLQKSRKTQPPGDHIRNRLGLIYNMARAFLNTGLYDSSLALSYDYLQALEDIDQPPLLLSGYGQLAELNLELNEANEALDYVKQAMEYANSPYDYLLLFPVLAEAQFEVGRDSVALETLVTGMDLAEQFGLLQIRAHCLQLKGRIAFRSGRLPEAFAAHQQVFEWVENMSNGELLPDAHYYLAEVCLALGNPLEARRHAAKSLELSLAGNRVKRQTDIYRVLAEANAAVGEFDQAYRFHVQSAALSDSLLNRETRLHLVKLKNTHQMQQQIQANQALLDAQQVKDAQLRQRTMLVVSLGVVVVLLVLVAVAFRTNARLKEQRNAFLEHEIEQRTAEYLDQREALIAMQQSAQLEEAKSHFFANVSHEFRTPLTLIMGTLDGLLNQTDVPQEVRNRLMRAQRNGHELLDLVGEVLDISKLDNAALALHLEPVWIRSHVLKSMEKFSSAVRQRNLSLHLEYDAHDRLCLQLDATKFARILNNLIANAVKFTPNGGEIRIAVDYRQRHLHVAVHDTGIGIPKDQLEAVFERFHQVPQPNTPVTLSNGTGIGLALCKEYLDLFGGDIWVESPGALHTGSSFFFHLPATSCDQYPNDEGEAISLVLPNVPRINTGGGSLLVVEDNEDLQAFLQEVLAPEHTVHCVSNGEQALAWLADPQHAHPALIISDIAMPVMDGFALLEALKSDDAYRHIPVVMLTARAEEKDRLKALRIGVDDYILKPFAAGDLRMRIGQLLHHRAQRMEDAAFESSAVPLEGPAHAPLLSEEDQRWLHTLEQEALQLIANFEYTAEDLARAMNMSRANFFRKVKRLTGLTVNQYIKEFRLQTARRMLEAGEVHSVKEASYTVGFKHINYFSKAYADRFGRRPSSYLGSEAADDMGAHSAS